MGDSSLHRFIMGNDSQKTALKAFNWISIVAGLVTIGAGVMGCIWGVKVLKPWPPLTWNNFVGGVFMILFGFAIIWMRLRRLALVANNPSSASTSPSLIISLAADSSSSSLACASFLWANSTASS